jgi:hypothetical protein
MSRDSRVVRVWPHPPEGLQYVQQTLPGGQYISTGMFSPKHVDERGRGRSFDNVQRVTSLFFDLDLLGLYDSARSARGSVLETKVAERKAKLYSEKPVVLAAFRRLLRTEFLSILEDVVGQPPTLVVDSGWGYHAHYAVAYEMQQEKHALRTIAAAIIDEANRRCADRARTMTPPLLYDAAFDATHDVGARLARMPGSVNTKSAGEHRKVEVVNGSPTLLDQEALLYLQREYVRQAQLPTGVPGGAADDSAMSVPTPARPQKSRAIDVDFRSMSLPDGRGWQQIAMSLAPGERMKVVCPFGGSTVGSGFFACEPDGRVRYYSGPTDTTYWNTYTAPARNGRADLVRGPDRKGQPGPILKTITNLLRMFREDEHFHLWYDAFSEREMDGDRPLTDTDWVRVLTHMDTVYQWGWRPSKDQVFSTMEYVCKENTRNPVRDYMDDLQWDGVPRMDRWLAEVCHVEDINLHRVYSRKWCIGVIARLFDPGVKHDCVLQIAGRQGFGKSTVFRKWVEIDGLPDLFTDTRINLKDKDSYMVLYSCLLYEDQEGSSLRGSDYNARKSFLSSQVDRFRKPFGRKVETFKRHTVIVSTSNDEATLVDPTGDRRWWCVRVPDEASANLEWLDQWRDQMWAEAVVAYKAGESWWLDQGQDAARAHANEDFRYLDWYTQCAAMVAESNGRGRANGFTIGQFAKAIGDKVDPYRSGRKLSSALYSQGFQRLRSNGLTKYFLPGEAQHNYNGLSAIAGLTKPTATMQAVVNHWSDDQ